MMNNFVVYKDMVDKDHMDLVDKDHMDLVDKEMEDNFLVHMDYMDKDCNYLDNKLVHIYMMDIFYNSKQKNLKNWNKGYNLN
jgi:hypothetical protein